MGTYSTKHFGEMVLAACKLKTSQGRPLVEIDLSFESKLWTITFRHSGKSPLRSNAVIPKTSSAFSLLKLSIEI
jgi:hypothetical protein